MIATNTSNVVNLSLLFISSLFIHGALNRGPLVHCLECKPEPNLYLSRVKCRGGPPERGERRRVAAESVVWHREIRTIEKIESFDEQFDASLFVECEVSA